MKILKVLFSVFFLTSCSSIKTTSSNKNRATPTQIQQQPVPVYEPEKLFSIASQFYNKGDFNRAFDFFSAAAAKFKLESKSFDSHLWAVRSLSKASRHSELLEYSKQNYSLDWSDKSRVELLKYNLNSSKLANDVNYFISKLDEAYLEPLLSSEKQKYYDIFVETLASLKPIELSQKTVESIKAPELKILVLSRLAEFERNDGNIDRAISIYKDIISIRPDSEVAKSVSKTLLLLESAKYVQPRSIGVVLPLTGKEAPQAQKVLKALQMGLDLTSESPSNFKLAIADTGGDPLKAKAAVEKLISEDQVIAIVGSVLSREAIIVAETASSLGVPSIGLSQRTDLTLVSSYSFRNALTSEIQTQLLTKEAIEKMNLKKFAILYPNDSYGVEYANRFWDFVIARGGEVVSAQVYKSGETDFTDSVQKLVGSYDPYLRASEFNLRNIEFKNRPKKARESDAGFVALPPIVSFDALFIPDTAKTLGQITATLVSNGIKTPVLLGTNLWNVSDLTRRAGVFSDRILLVDSFSPQETSFTDSKFTKEYLRNFGETPGNIELQAYDTALVLRNLIDNGASSRARLSRELADLNGVNGSVGSLYINEKREFIRPIKTLTIKDSIIQEFR